ncbi:MAG TPA: Ni/Fe hydrogenase [Rhodospirillaceae bacterium]|nr:Ni/Fe hydrogenase [Rhodospirillaceae bacterium]MAX61386.1 Ni/Fe hydrogenase [Rhodospirillaceae bacterium]MBB56133.1 Ni/Fe hydrogenase [Rhodospirillaceae bacterium]HAE01385.1 Ni/Fe hydrogenase [Rhodospirillaceae bacterium]HBM13589.1 Ni/Fe hydrogenase [Rhodospirillaceae bacterium]
MLSSTAFAHEGSGMAGGFVSGLTHPLFGLDHVVAMVAVGLWGAFLGRPALYLLPIIFPVVMAFGGALGVLGFPLPGVEIGIAGSAIVLGLLVALAARPPIWIASCLVGAFAIFHGYAHGAELPHAANAITYSIGFVLSTGMLHLIGIAFGMLVKMPSGRVAVRGLGVAISLVGVAFMTGIA